MRIQYNQGLFIQNRYNHTNTEINKTLNKLSSGYKINKASDDAAGLAISEKMRSQIRGLNQAGENIENGLSLLQTADAGLGNISNPNLQRMRELAIQAANDTLTDSDRAKIQEEIEQIKKGINDIADSTEFNTIKLLQPPIEMPPATPTGVVDLVFVFDDTGSMSVHQNKFADNISDLLTSIQNKGVNDIRIGVVNFSDDLYEFSSFSGSKWTSNSTEVIDEIRNIASSNQGGIENNMTALQKIIQNYDFREFPDSNTRYKHIILVTDELGNDNYLSSTVAQQLKDNHITVHGVHNNSSGINHVINETGGKKVQLSGNSNWGSQLSSVIGETIGEVANVPEEPDTMQPITLQIGPNEGQQITFNLYDCRAHKIGVDPLSVATRDEAEYALSKIDAAIELISNRRSEYGAIYNRLEFAHGNVKNAEENLIKAESRLRDADIANEVTKLKKRSSSSSIFPSYDGSSKSDEPGNFRTIRLILNINSTSQNCMTGAVLFLFLCFSLTQRFIVYFKFLKCILD